jgi:phosphate:Na+ symporter
MKEFYVVTAAFTAIILFIFGLENFSKEIEKISGERFRKFLANATNRPIVGVLLGAIITGVIQSSSATSVIAIGLVNAGVLSFKNSVGIIFGSNIGTTITAQLVAFELTAFAPILIILGFILSLFRSRYAVFAKSIFYFGFVFFSLNLISASLEPFKNSPMLVNYLATDHHPFVTVFAGAIFTALVQSSSVTTGLAVILTQQGFLTLSSAVPLIMGANLGTTITAVIAMLNMDVSAKKTALAHVFFNLGGVVLFMPILLLWGDQLEGLNGGASVTLAYIHFFFNVITSLIFIIFITPFTKMIDRFFGEGKMDFTRVSLPKDDEFEDPTELEQELKRILEDIYLFLQENYNLVTLSMETNYKTVFETAQKRIDYIEYLKGELVPFFSKRLTVLKVKGDTKKLLHIIHEMEYLMQIHDSIDDVYSIKKNLDDNFIEIKSDLLLHIRELSGKTIMLFDIILKSSFQHEIPITKVKKVAKELQEIIDSLNQEILTLLSHPHRQDAGALIHLVTYSQRLKDKLLSFEDILVVREKRKPRKSEYENKGDEEATS